MNTYMQVAAALDMLTPEASRAPRELAPRGTPEGTTMIVAIRHSAEADSLLLQLSFSEQLSSQREHPQRETVCPAASSVGGGRC